MDFLKTLLAYAALMAALGVQEGPAIEAVPTPTMLPPSVTATLVPHQTEAPTATPTFTPPPVPTITPNYKYDTLRYGDSGSDVRKLQRKLIELGYLEKGEDDSQYGYKTTNAVKAFQKANGLSADGVAGPSTLTNLYQNPNVLPKVNATAVPTATPTPTLEPIPTPPPAEAADELPEIPLPAATEAPADLAMQGWNKLDGGFIINGSTGKALYLQQVIGGQAALVKPGLWQNAEDQALVSLTDLAQCIEGWSLSGSDADKLYALKACGYDVSISLADAPKVMVDGQFIDLDAGEVLLIDGMVYVTDGFLQKALGAQTMFDVDESSLVLILTDKAQASSMD